MEGTHNAPLESPNGPIPATYKKVKGYGVQLFKIENGKIAEALIYFDQPDLITQLGLIPAGYGLTRRRWQPGPSRGRVSLFRPGQWHRLLAHRQAGVSSREPADPLSEKELVRFALDATRTALLVDDEATSRATHQTRLEGEGYTVFVAQNQADALSRAKTALPKVIFVHLAGGPGNLPLIQALRSDDTCRHIPVVVITDPTYVAKVRSKLHAVPHDSW